MIVRPMKLLTSLRASCSLRWLLCWPASCQKPYEGSSIHNLAETNITCEFNLESTHYLRSCEISNTHPRRRRNLARSAHCIAHPTALRAVRPGKCYIVCRRSSASIHARKAFLSSLKHKSTAHSRSRHYAMAANMITNSMLLQGQPHLKIAQLVSITSLANSCRLGHLS